MIADDGSGTGSPAGSRTVDRIDVAVVTPDAFVRVIGKGSYKLCPALKAFGLVALDQGCRRLVIDMASCIGMDSTFMGVVAGLTLRTNEQQGELVMVCLSDKNRLLLETLGLADLIRAETGRSAGGCPGGLRPLEPAVDRTDTTTTMLQAHETLVGVAPGNEARFRDVLGYLEGGTLYLKGQNRTLGPAPGR